MKRPALDPAPLPSAFPMPGTLMVTISPGQWDAMLQAAYDAGALLLEIEEVNGQERAVRAYRRGDQN